MIILSTGETLRAVLAAAPSTNQPTYSFAFGDDGQTRSLGNSKGALNGTTPIDVVPSPAAGAERVIRSGYIYNGDTQAVSITLSHFDGTNQRTLMSITLQPGCSLAIDGAGAHITDSTGAPLAPVSPLPAAQTFESVAVGNVQSNTVVCAVSGGVQNPSLASSAQVSAIVGVASTAANSGGAITVMTQGVLTESLWSWIPGEPVFCALTGGALTQVAPATGAVVVVGVALSATEIRVGIGQIYLRAS